MMSVTGAGREEKAFSWARETIWSVLICGKRVKVRVMSSVLVHSGLVFRMADAIWQFFETVKKVGMSAGFSMYKRMFARKAGVSVVGMRVVKNE